MMKKLPSFEASEYVKLQAAHRVVAGKNSRKIKDACEQTAEEKMNEKERNKIERRLSVYY
jgi:hypothetical protein